LIVPELPAFWPSLLLPPVASPSPSAITLPSLKLFSLVLLSVVLPWLLLSLLLSVVLP
jgi:hypothetical protein